MKKAIIYTRVSSKEQVDEGNSLGSQKRRAYEFASENNLIVQEYFEERGESAKTTNRPQLQAILKYVSAHRGEIDVLLIYKIDRLSRDTSDYLVLKEFFDKAGVTIVSLTENIDNSPSGRVMEKIISSFAQYDNEVRAERSKGGMVDGVRDGRWMWKAPLGYVNTRVEGSKNIAIDNRKGYAEALSAAWSLVDAGCTETEALRTVNSLLEDNGYPPIRIQSFSRMLRNKLYIGLVEGFGLSVQSRSILPLIDEGLFWRVQNILEGNKNLGSKYSKINPLYPLRGILMDKNGHKLTGSSPRGNGGVYPKYHCPKCRGQKISYSVSQVDARFSEYSQQIKIKNDIKAALKEAILLNLGDEHKKSEKEISKLSKRLVAIKAEKSTVVQKNINGVLPDQTTREQLSAYEHEEASIKIKLNQYSNDNEDAEELLAFGLDKLGNLAQTFESINDPNIRSRFQKWLFPAGLSYDGEKFGTNALPLILRVNQNTHKGALIDNSLLVTSRRIELRLPG